MMDVTASLIDARTNWVLGQCSGTILDIGGNDGHVFRNTGLDVVLLDINEFEPCEFPHIVADAHSLPFADKSFDCCVLAEILEHVHNPILVLREAVRVARKKVVFTVPDEYHWPAILKPFQTVRDVLEQNKDIPLEDMIREGNPTLIRLRDLQQIGHNRWYTQEMLESHLKYVSLPYQIQTVISKQAEPFDDGFSWFCGTITQKAAPENIFDRPEYWCGKLGYRPDVDGIGYRDYPLNQVKVEHILARHPRGSLLDVGCAFGYIVKRLRDKGVDALGIDISQYALSQAPKDVKPYLKHGSADSLPWPDKYFDMVITFGVLEHLSPELLPKAISEIKRVARRGIISVTPGDDPYFNGDIAHKTKQPLSWWRNLFPPEFEVRPDANEEWTRPPKILCISTAVYPVSPELRYGGIERLCYLISEELNRRGFRVSVVAPEGSQFSKEVTHISTGPCIAAIEGEWEVYKYYDQALNDFDAIISFDHRHLAMLNHTLPALAFIWHPPSVMQFPLPSYNIACLSEFQKQELWQYQGLNSQVIDPHCVDPTTYLPQVKGNGRYLFIGRLNSGKGVRNAIKLCRELGVGLDIIGGLGYGDPPEYLDWVKDNCDTEQIIYHGNVSDSVKFQFIARAKAGLHTVNYPEPSSHKTIELLCGGLPVVAYDIGANKEIIEHGVNGFIAQNEEEFKEYMFRGDSLSRDLIRERGLKRWSVEATVDRLIPTLKEVTGGLRWK